MPSTLIKPTDASPSSGYGARILGTNLDLHTGIDFPGYKGKSIVAVRAGVITNVYFNGELDKYGNTLILQHESTQEAKFSLYAHLDEFTVSKGQQVKEGQVIGRMGNTAAAKDNPSRTVGVHLHFELLNKWPSSGRDLDRVDPTAYLGLSTNNSPALLAQQIVSRFSMSQEEAVGEIAKFYEATRLAVLNVITHKRSVNNNQRIISDAGFRELASIGLPSQGSIPNFQSTPTKSIVGKVRNPDFIPSAFIIYGFGGDADKTQLSKNRAQTNVGGETGTGFNSAKYANSVKALASTNPERLTHHLISRRGDLVNSTAWNMDAFHNVTTSLDKKLATPYLQEIDRLSISVELEEFYVRHTDEKLLHPITNRAPCTDQQYASLAFILKKYISWVGSSTILTWLGPTGAAHARNKAIGCVALNANRGFPLEEFLFPPGFKKGDPIPAHLWVDEKGNNTKALFEKRIELFYKDVKAGTPLSAWDIVFEKVNKLRTYKLESEIFDFSFSKDRILLETPAVTGTQIAAVAGKVGRDTVTQTQRAQALGTQTRAQISEGSRVQNTVVQAILTQQSSNAANVARNAVTEPIIRNTTLFDYSTGQWVTTSTRNLING